MGKHRGRRCLALLLTLILCLGLLPAAGASGNTAVVVPGPAIVFEVQRSSMSSQDPNDYYTVTTIVECPVCGEVSEGSVTLSRWDALLGVNDPVDSDIEAAGYTFAGWYDGEGSPWTAPGQPVTDENAVEAGQTVTVPGNESTVIPVTPQAAAGNNAAAPAALMALNRDAEPVEDITIYARWEAPSQCEIRFSTGSAALRRTVGEKLGAVDVPSREGATFQGWYSYCHGKELTWTEDTEVKGNATLTARWEESSTIPALTVTYNPDNGDPVTMVSGSNAGEPVKLTPPEDPVRTGYRFLGWYTEDGYKWDFENDRTGQSMTLTAKWEPLGAFTVDFDWNGANVQPIPTMTVQAGQPVPRWYGPQGGSWEGHTFLGWATEDGTLWERSAPVTGNMVLYAVWDPPIERPEDTFRFSNSSTYFDPDGKYTLSTPYFEALVQTSGGATYVMSDGRRLSSEEYWREKTEQTWSGSCFGMAAVYSLARLDLLDPGTFQTGAELLYDLDYPRDSVNVRDLIQYYYLIQITPHTAKERKNYDTRNEAANLRELIGQLDENGAYVMLGLEFRNKTGQRMAGHAVVAQSYTTTASGYDVTIWDPNSPGALHHLTFDRNFGSASFDYTVADYPVTFVTYALLPEDYNQPDLTSLWKGTRSTAAGGGENVSFLSMASGDFRIETGDGRYAVVENGAVVEGDLEIAECTADGLSADGSTSAIRSFFFDGTGVTDVTVEVEGGARELSLLNGDNFYAVDGDRVTGMTFTPDCVTTSASASGLQTISLVSADLGDAWNKLTVSGSDTAFTVAADDEQATVTSAHAVSATVTAQNVFTRRESAGKTLDVTAQGVTLSTAADALEEAGESAAPQGGTNPFTDVQAGTYYYDAVLWAVEQGVTSGTSASTFSPDATCTRGQVVTFLWRAMGQPEPQTAQNPFTDVKESDYYYKAVLWAYENQITSGTGPSTFNPDAPCTRGQVVTFLWRAEGTPDAAGSGAFADVAAQAYYAQAVNWAVEQNITSGTGEATFSPEAVCTRGQIVTFLYRDMAKP